MLDVRFSMFGIRQVYFKHSKLFKNVSIYCNLFIISKLTPKHRTSKYEQLILNEYILRTEYKTKPLP
jgi:hypothetical protein